MGSDREIQLDGRSGFGGLLVVCSECFFEDWEGKAAAGAAGDEDECIESCEIGGFGYPAVWAFEEHGLG